MTKLKRVLGYVLIVWGSVGILIDLLSIASSRSISPLMIGNLVVCIVFIWGGIKLKRKQEV